MTCRPLLMKPPPSSLSNLSRPDATHGALPPTCSETRYPSCVSAAVSVCESPCVFSSVSRCKASCARPSASVGPCSAFISSSPIFRRKRASAASLTADMYASRFAVVGVVSISPVNSLSVTSVQLRPASARMVSASKLPLSSYCRRIARKISCSGTEENISSGSPAASGNSDESISNEPMTPYSFIMEFMSVTSMCPSLRRTAWAVVRMLSVSFRLILVG